MTAPRSMSRISEPSIFARIVDGAEAAEEELSDEATNIVGVWNVEYSVKLRPGSTPLHLLHVCVQTSCIGTSYYERYSQGTPRIDESLLGRNALTSPLSPLPLRIAALDAVYGSLVSRPSKLHRLKGSGSEMAGWRADVVVAEALRLIGSRTPKGARPRIVNVGVVGDFLERLAKIDGVDVAATDNYDAIIDELIHGIRITHGRNTLSHVAAADLAIVTGMTLANDTLDQILSTAKESGTAILLFAQTGANFANVYLDAGIATVVSEPYPFYLSGTDNCTVKVYRSNLRGRGSVRSQRQGEVALHRSDK